MRADTYDVVVIGGGIHGAGVAQAAAARGYSVLLVEQAELAQGTSSRSSKLIHGGLRYLEGFQFGLVRECLRERTILLRIAPDLVRLQPFYIPIYRDTRRHRWQVAAGLSLYALLGDRRTGRFRHVAEAEWDKLDGLRREGLLAVYQYWDAQTDDAALTRAVAASAQRLGAEVRIRTRCMAAERGGDTWTITLAAEGRTESVQGRSLVNATGAWVNTFLERVMPQPSTLPVELVQGTHLQLPVPLLQGHYYLEAPLDQRAVFVMPWQGGILLGTTEKPYTGDPAAVQPTRTETEYLLATLAHYFPSLAGIQPVAAFAGLRVLPMGASAAFGRSRDTLLDVEGDGMPMLISLAGGKLTAYRATAERVIARLAPDLPARRVRADTATLSLTR